MVGGALDSPLRESWVEGAQPLGRRAVRSVGLDEPAKAQSGLGSTPPK